MASKAKKPVSKKTVNVDGKPTTKIPSWGKPRNSGYSLLHMEFKVDEKGDGNTTTLKDCAVRGSIHGLENAFIALANADKNVQTAMIRATAHIMREFEAKTSNPLAKMLDDLINSSKS